MLTPEDLDRAGELTAAVYVQIEAEMLDYLVGRMLDGDVSGQRAQTAILLLAQSARPQLEAILAEHADEIDGAVQREVEGALMRSDAADLDYIRQGLGVELPALTTRQTAATCAGVVEILQRHNLGMVQAAQDAFVRHSAEAMVQVNTGAMTTERALHRAVQRLEAEGITMVDYVDPGTGRATVSNHVDVAVRRHVRTQIAQAGERLTEQRMDEAGVEFVEVSSHSGARESHRAWEGRVYSRHGDRTVDGVRYRDFHAACNYGDVADGIYGANCRHSHGPYIPGMPRAYGPNPEHPSGLSNDEVYELTQGQRRRERGIRAAKRELRGAQLAYEKDPSPANLAEVNRAKQKLRNRQEAMRGFVDEANGKCRPGTAVLQRSPRREWADDMPKGAAPKASGKSIAEYASSPAAARRAEALGFTKTELGQYMRAAAGAAKLPPKGFRVLSADEQRNLEDAALKQLTRERFKTASRARRAAERVNPKFDPTDPKHSQNCQRCVATFEALMRGENVTAKPILVDPRVDPIAQNPLLPYDGAQWKACLGADVRSVERIMRGWGDGARAIARVVWKDSNEQYGHVFSVLQIGDETVFIDSQKPSRNPRAWYNLETIESLSYIARIDDKPLTDWTEQCFENAT